jgi:hypothetical protein
MGYQNIKAFSDALDGAGWEYLSRRNVAQADRFRFRVDECPIHGPGCARVTYGMLPEHVVWSRTDAVDAAAAMLGTMLPAMSNARGDGQRRD